MSQVAQIANILSREELAATTTWQQALASPLDRDGVLVFNAGTTDAYYRLVGIDGTAPSGTASKATSTGLIIPGQTVHLQIGAKVDIYIGLASSTGTVVLEETA